MEKLKILEQTVKKIPDGYTNRTKVHRNSQLKLYTYNTKQYVVTKSYTVSFIGTLSANMNLVYLLMGNFIKIL